MEIKVLTENKIARHEYFILETFEAGIVLEGAEVKSLRRGNGNIKDSFCFIEDGELFLKNAHISVYEKAGSFNSKNAKRDRKLLLHKTELCKIRAKVEQKGLTLIPLKIYLKQSLIKVELGLCKGKKLYDKKKDLKEKDILRENERSLRS